MFKEFLKDSNYLLKYGIKNFTFLIIINISLFYFSKTGNIDLFWIWIAGLFLFIMPYFGFIFISGLYYFLLYFCYNELTYDFYNLLCIPLGVLSGTISAALMHNAAHGNIKPKFANFLTGELCGLFQITGFVGWKIAHILHHSHPDIPGKDPHPPMKLSYTKYANSMGFMMKNALTKKYFDVMGVSTKTKFTMSIVLILSSINRFLRVFLIFLLLGPKLFVFFYIPFKIANSLIYIDFNYRTHRPLDDGSFEIINLNNNYWFKLLNFISFGSYFHLNHHRQPSVFNPKNINSRDLIRKSSTTKGEVMTERMVIK